MFRTHHLILVVLGYFAVLMPGLFGATEPGDLPEAYTNYSLNSSGISNNEETSPGLTSTNSK